MHHPQLKFSARRKDAAFAAIAGEFFYPALVSLESLKCENTAEVMTRRTWKNHSSFFGTGMGHIMVRWGRAWDEHKGSSHHDVAHTRDEGRCRMWTGGGRGGRGGRGLALCALLQTFNQNI